MLWIRIPSPGNRLRILPPPGSCCMESVCGLDVSIGGLDELEGDEPSLGCCWFWGLSGSGSFCSSEFNGMLVPLRVYLDEPLVSRRLSNACCPNKAEIMKRNRPRAATFPLRENSKCHCSNTREPVRKASRVKTPPVPPFQQFTFRAARGWTACDLQGGRAMPPGGERAPRPARQW